MGIPFQIMMPKVKIENRDILISFSSLPRAGEEKVNTVIDYWSITDRQGRSMRDIPEGKNSFFSKEQYGKKIELVMKDAGKNLSFDCLDICIHFLTQNGLNISTHYTYKIIGYDFSFSRIDVIPMNSSDEATFVDFLVKAAENERTNSHSSKSRTNDGDTAHIGCTDDLSSFMRAIDREMRYLRGSGGRRYKITNGQFVMHSQGGYIYSFDLDAELYLAEDSPVTVTVGLDSIPGVVLLCENFQVILALDKIPNADKTMKIPKADISAEPWRLLEKLNERLGGISQSNEIAMSLLKDGPRLATSGPLSSIARGQDKALEHALNSPISVIWGPPGTGKTYIMAKIASEFLSQRKKILIVSHSNVSVDNVAKQIYNQLKDSSLSQLLHQSKILRYGYVRDEELQKNDLVASFKVVINNSADKGRFDKLQEEYSRLTREAETSTDSEINKRILAINQEIKTIKARHKNTEQLLVKNAHLVATTVSKIYAELLFGSLKYDVVMFDEISMAYVPQILAAGSFATEHLICVGDFRQLSPIVQEKNAKSVLGKDLFEYLNISKGFRDINPHPWLIMLDEQRRMHPAVSAFPSKFVYNGLLKDHESVKTKRNNIASTAPFNQPMCLIDLYGTSCFGSKNEDNSRYNILSAVFSFATALKSEKSQANLLDVSDEEKVGIITPYAAQTRLIKAMIQDHRQHKYKTNISCATVHQFQGSERNVIVFDAVESCPSTRAGWLMSKNEGGSVTRLINVALTRARGKFIAIANKAFWLNKFESSNMFHSLVKYMGETSYILDHRNNALANYISSNDFGRNINVYTSTIACNCDVIDDIRTARSRIMLMIPRGRINSEYAKLILDEIYHRSQTIQVVIVYDKSVIIPSEYESISIPSDKVTMPLLFVDNIAWYGLPVYHHDYVEGQVRYPINTDIIVKFNGKCTVEMIKSLVEHASVKAPVANGLALYVKNKCKCIQCGEPLSMVKANKHFLKCKKCGKTQILPKETVNHYLDSTGGKCSRCGKDLYTVNGQYGLYVKCSENHMFKLDEI